MGVARFVRSTITVLPIFVVEPVKKNQTNLAHGCRTRFFDVEIHFG